MMTLYTLRGYSQGRKKSDGSEFLNLHFTKPSQFNNFEGEEIVGRFNQRTGYVGGIYYEPKQPLKLVLGGHYQVLYNERGFVDSIEYIEE